MSFNTAKQIERAFICNLRGLGIANSDDFVVCGSAAMSLSGIDIACKDIDILNDLRLIDVIIKKARRENLQNTCRKVGTNSYKYVWRGFDVGSMARRDDWKFNVSPAGVRYLDHKANIAFYQVLKTTQGLLEIYHHKFDFRIEAIQQHLNSLKG